MSALAHNIESSGVPTAVIALIRPQVERVKPPRAVWVPFELGRPLGPPNNFEFQSKVLRQLLSLFDQMSPSSILQDYPLEAPGEQKDVNWQAPLFSSIHDEELSASMKKEMGALKPFYDRSCEKTQRTAVGVSGLSLDQVRDYILNFLSNDWPTSPNSHWHFAQALRFAADDLKSYYIEAATTGDGQPSATQLADWFWEGTIAGRVLTIVRQNLLESDDKAAVDIGDGSIVPRSRV